MSEEQTCPPVDCVPDHPSLEFSEDRQTGSSSSSSSTSGSNSSSSSSTTSNSSISTNESSSSSGSDAQQQDAWQQREKRSRRSVTPTVQPYVTKMERFELFRTEQCYYLIASDKAASAFRVIKMDRTLIEYPVTDDVNNSRFQAGATNQSSSGGRKSGDNGVDSGNIHEQMDETRKLRRLPEFCVEDPTIYTGDEIRNMLDMIRDGDQTQSNGSVAEGSVESNPSGDLEPLVRAHGIVGFIRFLDCYYLTLITKKSKIGCIGGNIIYTIKDTETFPIKPADNMRSSASVLDGAGNDPQSMLLNMWNRGKRSLNMGLTPREAAELRYQLIYQSVDLGKDFFFSYTYDLTQSLQNNMLAMTPKTYPPPPFKSMYMWNYFQTRELEEVTGSMTSFHWIMPLIHGAFIQRKLQDYGRSLNLLLLARRSRHFAGTRYRKRGVSDVGKVANDVEHEQIVHDESTVGEGVFASFLQVRGSIPTYWAQESSVTMPKPPIVLNRVDPTYQATQLHFEDLFKRYGAPIVVVDLVKQSEKREREVIVGNEYRHALEYLNHQIDDKHKIRYCALDYSHISKHRNHNVSSSLHDVSTWAVNQTGFFCSSPRWKIVEDGLVVPFSDIDDMESTKIKYHMGVPIFPMEQEGVLRTNCIDCLDRTNVAQFSGGVEALGQQLVVMGIRSAAKLSPASSIVRLLIDMYVEIGDHIALQYGGSEAHKKVQVQSSGVDAKGDGLGKHKELLTSIRRYYSNVLTDSLKQEAMNLFLGHYIPSQNPLPLWELENDYYLHNFHVKSGTASMQSMRKRCPSVNSIEECDTMPSGRSELLLAGASGMGASNSLLNRNQPRRGLPSSTQVESKKTHESWRVEKIRKRCSLQNEALSFWWRNAIQSYIDQRCWMHLGENPFESMIPTRFERDHGAADQLSVFDHFFKRPYTKPLQSFHSSQNKKAVEEEKESLLRARKKMSSKDVEDHNEISPGLDDEPRWNIVQFASQFGYENASKPYIQNFVRSQAKKHSSHGRAKANDNDEKFAQYSRYVQPGDYQGARREHKDQIKKEFASCLHDVSLQSDNVSAVLKLSQDAHVNSEILNGPYRGLSQHESAIDVTTIVNEQFNALHSLKTKGRLSGEDKIASHIEEELKRREMDTPGVMDAINEGWKHFAESESCYREVLSSESLFHRRSDLTDASSMKLYCSFFGVDTKMTNNDIRHVTGGKQLPAKAEEQSKAKHTFDLTQSRLMNKARTLGIHIGEGSEKSEQTDFPDGFEQINENMFARKDNRFMVFNDVGVGQWPPKSKTKIGSIEHDMNLMRHTTVNL